MKKVLYGFILGVTYIIPGLCSASMAISLGVYNDLLELFSKFYKFKVLKKHLLFILGMMLGIVFAICFFVSLYDRFPYLFIALFMGFIASGFKRTSNKIQGNKQKVLIYLLIIFGLLSINLLGNFRILSFGENITLFTYIYFFCVGILGSLALILPGVSGAMVLFIFGVYEIILKSVKWILTNFSQVQPLVEGKIGLLALFFVGLLVGILAFSKIIDKFYNQNPSLFLLISNAFLVGSIIILGFNLLYCTSLSYKLFISVGLIVIGYLIGLKMKKKS